MIVLARGRAAIGVVVAVAGTVVTVGVVVAVAGTVAVAGMAVTSVGGRAPTRVVATVEVVARAPTRVHVVEMVARVVAEAVVLLRSRRQGLVEVCRRRMSMKVGRPRISRGCAYTVYSQRAYSTGSSFVLETIRICKLWENEMCDTVHQHRGTQMQIDDEHT